MDIIWLLRNDYKDVTEELKRRGFNPPKDTKWSEWSMGQTKYITTNGKFYAKRE